MRIFSTKILPLMLLSSEEVNKHNIDKYDCQSTIDSITLDILVKNEK